MQKKIKDELLPVSFLFFRFKWCQCTVFQTIYKSIRIGQKSIRDVWIKSSVQCSLSNSKNSKLVKVWLILTDRSETEPGRLNFQVRKNQPGPCCSDRKFNPSTSFCVQMPPQPVFNHTQLPESLVELEKVYRKENTFGVKVPLEAF